jgi:hypothetical protein
MDDDVAYAVYITQLCQELHCLPSAGGLLDQDSYHVWMMGKVIDAQNERRAKDNKKK